MNSMLEKPKSSFRSESKRIVPKFESFREQTDTEKKYREAKRRYGEIASQKESRLEDRSAALEHAREFGSRMKLEGASRFDEVPDLEMISPEYAKYRNKKLKIIEGYIAIIQNYNLAKKSFRACTDNAKRKFWLTEIAKYKKDLEMMFSDPREIPSFEKALYKYIEQKQQYREFRRLEEELVNIEEKLTKEELIDKPGELSEIELARVATISGNARHDVEYVEKETEELLKTLELVAKDDDEFELMKRELLEEKVGEKKKKAITRAELLERKKETEEKLDELWELPQIQRNEKASQLRDLIEAVHTGKDVIETASVVESINKVTRWEKEHPNATLGAVLVGEPGTGKTTLIHHYLELLGRNYVYLDLSEEVTRYMLFGSKSLENKDYVIGMEALGDRIEKMNDREFVKFIKEQSKKVADTFKLKEEEATVVAVGQLEEELTDDKINNLTSELKEKASLIKGKISEFVKKSVRNETARQLYHTVHKNGWRDGVVIAALRRGESVLLDEFNKCRDLTPFFGLLTAKPGTDWYFEDNDERIHIPKDWRMYFTANIGVRHGGYKVAEAIASRAQGEVMEITYPESREESLVALTFLTGRDGNFLRSDEDLIKMRVLVKDVFPKVRKLLSGKDGTVPVSWRTLRRLAEKLITTKDVGGNKLKTASSVSFDEALYEVMVESYKLYEDKKVPQEIVKICTSVGLLLSNDVRKAIVKENKFMSEADWDEAAKIHNEGEKKTFEELIKAMREDLTLSSMMGEISSRPKRIKK